KPIMVPTSSTVSLADRPRRGGRHSNGDASGCSSRGGVRRGALPFRGHPCQDWPRGDAASEGRHARRARGAVMPKLSRFRSLGFTSCLAIAVCASCSSPLPTGGPSAAGGGGGGGGAADAGSNPPPGGPPEAGVGGAGGAPAPGTPDGGATDGSGPGGT